MANNRRSIKPRRAVFAGPGFHENPEKSLGYLVINANRLLRQELKRRLEPVGLSIPQGYVLRYLRNEDGLYQKDLAGRSGSHENAMVATVDALEEAGLVVRMRSKDDRRKVHVYLSAEGQKMCDEVLLSARDTSRLALTGVTKEDLAATMRVLRQIGDNLEAGRVDAELAS